MTIDKFMTKNISDLSKIIGVDISSLSKFMGNGVSAVSGYMQATGGTITDVTIEDKNYKIHRFTTTGASTLQVTQVTGSPLLEYLIVGGGGGSGRAQSAGAGGGIVIEGSFVPIVTGYNVTVGAGGAGQGAGGSPAQTNGGNSIFNAVTALGGICSSVNQSVGPSCGIYIGGNKKIVTNYHVLLGGGAGAGGNGGHANSTNAGNGGIGAVSSIIGTPTYYGGGGGGGVYSEYGVHLVGGTGGNGGGGNGGSVNPTLAGQNGTPNTGGGAGGSYQNTIGAGRAGGSGIVIVRYQY